MSKQRSHFMAESTSPEWQGTLHIVCVCRKTGAHAKSHLLLGEVNLLRPSGGRRESNDRQIE